MTDFTTIKKFLQGLSDDEVRKACQGLNQLSVATWAGFEFGVRQGWWEDYTEAKPIPFPKIFHLSDFKTKAELLAHLGVFPSISQARKNGFDGVLTLGEYTFPKNTRVRIVE